MIPLHVISLKPSVERRAQMARQLDALGIPFTFFDAVDGRAMSPSELENAAPHGGKDHGHMTSGEIGCALSHLAVIAEGARRDSEYFAVIEDDVLFKPGFGEILSADFLRSLPRFDILQLAIGTNKPTLTLSLGQIGDFALTTAPQGRFNMCAIIYSRAAARDIVERFKVITSPIDNMIFHDRRPFRFRVIELRPPVASGNPAMSSDIGTRPRLRGLIAKAKREVQLLRNSIRLWASFICVWGPASLVRLRLERARPR